MPAPQQASLWLHDIESGHHATDLTAGANLEVLMSYSLMLKVRIFSISHFFWGGGNSAHV